MTELTVKIDLKVFVASVGFGGFCSSIFDFYSDLTTLVFTFDTSPNYRDMI